MAVNDNLLLYIEPVNPPSVEPVIDDITCTMVAAFRKALHGLVNYSSAEPPYDFHFGGGYRGLHVCSCGVGSSNCDYQLPNGEITNSLAIHYLAYHRDEISEEQLKRVSALTDEVAIPTYNELSTPKSAKKFTDDEIMSLVSRQSEPAPLPESLYGDKRWVIGHRDRGFGHGDYAVIEQGGKVIAEPGNFEDVHLIVTACNHHKELLALAEKALKLINADSFPVSEADAIEKRILEIKNYEKD